METLINILLGFLFFMFVATAITVVSAWLVLQFIGTKRERKECCGGNACCKEKVEGLSNPIPTQEACCKDDMSDCSCDEPFIIEGYHNGMEVEGINDFERKTEISGMGGSGGPVDSIRSRHNKMIRESEDVSDGVDSIPMLDRPLNKEEKEYYNRDYVNFLDEQERKSKKDYHNEPLEENDPNIHQK